MIPIKDILIDDIRNIIYQDAFYRNQLFTINIFLVLSGHLSCNDLSCIIWKDVFFQKKWYFFFGGKMKDDLSQEVHGNLIFSVYTYGYYRYGATPLCQEKLKMIFSAKMHLKVIDILDWYSRKGSNNSLYFYGDLYRRFHILLSSEKKTGNLIYRIEV